jgi:CopG antitoxin of type II toxin-antitoxin system
MDANRRSSVSQAKTLEEMGEFWDTHDFTEFDTDAPDVEFTMDRSVAIEAELLAALQETARLRGVSIETLVNLWLQQKLIAETSSEPV